MVSHFQALHQLSLASNLSALGIGLSLEPEFHPGKLGYSTTVPYSVTQMSVETTVDQVSDLSSGPILGNRVALLCNGSASEASVIDSNTAVQQDGSTIDLEVGVTTFEVCFCHRPCGMLHGNRVQCRSLCMDGHRRAMRGLASTPLWWSGCFPCWL